MTQVKKPPDERTDKKIGWHFLEIDPDDLPIPGERVIIDIGHAFVGEGYLKQDQKWYRYCDFDPVEKYMSVPVVAWRSMPGPSKKPGHSKNER